MECRIRKRRMKDAADFAAVINNKDIQDNLRDGLPYPYTEKDTGEFISAMLAAGENQIYAFAITVGDKVIGSIGVYRQDNNHARTAEMGYYIAKGYWPVCLLALVLFF